MRGSRGCLCGVGLDALWLWWNGLVCVSVMPLALLEHWALSSRSAAAPLSQQALVLIDLAAACAF